jgi:hypothetical protein
MLLMVLMLVSNGVLGDVISLLCLLGTGVNVAPEIIVRASIVLPHKDIAHNVNNQILL